MASNYFGGGSSGDTVVFDRPVNHLNIFVGVGVTFSFSLDAGVNYTTLPAGFHSFRVGVISDVIVSSTGDWSLIGVQA